MLLILLAAAFIAALLISNKIAGKISTQRYYSSLIIAGIISAVWYSQQLTTESTETFKWKAINPTFQLICYVFPILFLVFLIILSVLNSIKGKKSRNKKINVMHPFTVVFFTSFFLITGLYANFIEPNMIETVHININTDKWRNNEKPVKIVQISDLHIDKIGYREKSALRIINEQNPDIIVLTGDYVNDEKSFKKLRAAKQFFKKLHAPDGIFAVDGNWDTDKIMDQLLEDTDIIRLDNESMVVNASAGRIRMSGISWDEVLRDHPEIPENSRGRRNEFSIMLCHMPRISKFAPSEIDLILSGHTHGGQIKLPFIQYITKGTRLEEKQLSGKIELTGRKVLYINRGLGMQGGISPKVRFRCRPEITVFTIK